MCDCSPLSPFFYYEFGAGVRTLGSSRRDSPKPVSSRNELPAKISGAARHAGGNPGGDSKAGTCRIRLSGKGSGMNLQKTPVFYHFRGVTGRRDAWSSAGVGGDAGEFEPEKYGSLDVVFSRESREGERRAANVSSGSNPSSGEEKGDNSDGGATVPSSFHLLDLSRELEEEEERSMQNGGRSEEEVNDLIRPKGFGRAILESETEGEVVRRQCSRIGRQMLRRSSLLAKQVISMQSACSLGFVSQLWVDTRSWVVDVVEVRPKLLSGEMDKFLLEDVCQVGDVVLVQDESVVENELKMIGLESLVGYNVVTSGRHSVGKVRGYNFNINSGAVESLELDSFGMSIIPASLVSTYCLLVEDVLEVVRDTVVVREDSLSRVQRLTKGVWDTLTVDTPKSGSEKFTGDRRRSSRSVHSGNNRRNNSSRKFPSRTREFDDDWDLPMDF